MAEQKTENASGQEFVIQKIYVKDLSFEAPNAPMIFHDEWKPQIELELNNNAQPLEEGMYEVQLSITVNAKLQEKVAFIVEVQLAGIFTIKDFPEEQIKPMLGSFCPNVLYPYAREVIADVVNRGGFPPLNLAPVNFDALYQQHEQKLQEQATTEKAN